jgi:hypothetical protein
VGTSEGKGGVPQVTLATGSGGQSVEGFGRAPEPARRIELGPRCRIELGQYSLYSGLFECRAEALGVALCLCRVAAELRTEVGPIHGAPRCTEMPQQPSYRVKHLLLGSGDVHLAQHPAHAPGQGGASGLQ